MDSRGIAVFLIVTVGVGVFGYRLGQQDVSEPPKTGSGVADSGGDSAPQTRNIALGGNVSGQAGLNQDGKLAHFEIGSRNVKSMFADGNVVWLATSGGVIRYDIATDAYRVFDNKTSGILSNGIFHVSKLQGNIVVGTYGGGLSVYDQAKDQWRNLNIPNGLADQFVYDVEQAPNGDIWIATWSGANRIRGGALDDPSQWETFTVENTNGGLPNPWVYGVEAGQNGEMWFATESGLARYKDGEWRNWQHSDGLGAPYEQVRDAIQFTNDPARASKHHARQKSQQGLDDVDVAYNPNYIISLEVDREGNVWCGTWGGGLARFDGSEWKNYTSADGLPGNHIFMLYRDPQGEIWAGTSKGLARVDRAEERFSTFTVADGLYADNVFSMANAADGSVWVGSFGGLARFSSEDWRR
jgi:ligand-binding sensor domain-containing protein